MEEYKDKRLAVVGPLISVRELGELMRRVQDGKEEGKSVEYLLNEEGVRALENRGEIAEY